MKFNKQDLAHSRNMLKALGKGEWKLDGMEVLAFAGMMQWFSNLQKSIEEQIAKEDALAKVNQDKPLVPQEVTDPVKPIDNKKVSKKKE